MPDADGYLAAAYLVFLALILVYVAIMAVRLGRLERELGELNQALLDPKEQAVGSASEREPKAALSLSEEAAP
jgi:CcmD family protein